MGKFRRLKRELVVFFSKICLRSARNDYFGLDLKYPIIYGMGRGYVVPKEVWMGQCLDAFLRSKRGCVIDIGVNVGVYLVKLKVLHDDIAYIGFEPNAVCNYYTNELIRLNGFKNAKVLPVALSNELSVKTLYAGKLGDKTASLLVDTKGDEANLDFSSDIITVEGDAFIKLLDVKEIAVIKIDVEGAELFVLNGLKKTVEEFRPFFYIEIWANSEKGAESEERVCNIFELITSRDYIVMGTDGKGKLEFVKSPDDILNQGDANYMFIPNELKDVYIKNVGEIDNCEVVL